MTETKRVPVEPCPFCGSGMQDCDVQLGTEDREGFPVNIICPDCGACGPWVYARHPHLADAAMREWNRRIAAAPPEDELARLEREIRAELDRAMTKFNHWPTDPIHAAMVIAEESGELMRAVLQACYEPMKAGSDHVREEAIQTAAMCLRFLLSMRQYKFEPGPQHPDNPNLVRIKEQSDD